MNPSLDWATIVEPETRERAQRSAACVRAIAASDSYRSSMGDWRLTLLASLLATLATCTPDVGSVTVAEENSASATTSPCMSVYAVADEPEEEDVAFFEKKYQKKITGVKPKSEYSDPDQFYSAIGEQLGIPDIAWNTAAEKFGWKKDDGQRTLTMLKGGPTAGAKQGTWDVLFIRSKINPETKKPEPATAEQVMVQLDYNGNYKIFVRAKKANDKAETWEQKAAGKTRPRAAGR